MPRIEPQGLKFKRIEVSLRQILLDFSKVTREIDKALAGRRSKQEMELLHSIRQELVQIHKQSFKVLQHLFNGVESPNAK